ncbi:cylicin I [Fusarium beomiforme]|uniref:Cylicin I n=1 Tax=Fusarium beomiforme TaxID=44412 RepID=A0A9P5DXW3_9HYPO|nr:cylicin I [Fusarium beomiforme]
MTNYLNDPALYIYTSLTAGSSHIVTATSRLETILRANRVPFKAIDIAVDTKARLLWGRRAGKDKNGRPRKLPALVQEGWVLGDIVEIEEWNEYGELKEHVTIYMDEFTIPSINDKLPEPPLKRPIDLTGGLLSSMTPSPVARAVAAAAASAAATPKPAPTGPPLPEAKTSTPAGTPKTSTEPKKEEKTLPIRSVADEAARKAKELRSKALRAKVHGKDGAEPKKDDKSAKETGKSKESDTPAAKVDGIQSPTSSSWAETNAGRNAIQSPTSGTWKDSGSGSIASLKRASVEVSPDEAKTIEAKTAIKEEPELEKNAETKSDDDDSDEDDETDEEEEDDDTDEDSEEEDDDDETDEEEEEEAKKTVITPEPKTEAAASTETKVDKPKEELKDSKKEVKKDSHQDSKKDSKKDHKKDVKKHTKKSVKKDSKKDTKKDVKKDSKKDSHKDSKKDTKRDTKKEVKKDAKK